MSVLFQCARRQIYFVNEDQTNCFIKGLISHISKKTVLVRVGPGEGLALEKPALKFYYKGEFKRKLSRRASFA